MATNDNENAKIEENKPTDKNEQFEKEKDFQRSLSNHREDKDPTAQRNTGAQGYTQRSDQKDQLQNLHIGGSETEPQGANDSESETEQQGPGFTKEGSYEMGNAIRSQDQDFGDAAPSGPAKPAHD